jgi:hypothetical protein
MSFITIEEIVDGPEIAAYLLVQKVQQNLFE